MKIELGSLVEVKIEEISDTSEGVSVRYAGTCRLLVVGHSVDSEGTVYHTLSSIPVPFPTEPQHQMLYKGNGFVYDGVTSDQLKVVSSKPVSLYPDLWVWLQPN